MGLGENIKKHRKLKKITQSDLGKMINKSLRMIQKYESGDVVPSLDIISDIATALAIDKNLLLNTDPRKDYYFDYNIIVDLTYDLYEEMYNHSRTKGEIGFTAKEFMNKDKYFIDGLANRFMKMVLVDSEALKNRILGKDNSPTNKPLSLSYAPNSFIEDSNGLITSVVSSFELGNKLNDKKYLEFMIDRYKCYLTNVKNGIDNYKLIEENLEQAFKDYNDSINKDEDSSPRRKATQEDIDRLLGIKR